MRALSVLLVLCAAGTASAATPLERYLAARDRAVADVERAAAKGDFDAAAEKDKRALQELEAMVRGMVGPVAVKGFAPEGRINLDTLLKELGYGKLDGLLFAGRREDTSLVVTTGGLLAAWLKDRGMAPEGALRSDAFYTQAISPGASVARFAEIPVAAPGGATVYAMLAAYRQDIGPWMPGALILSATKGDRVYILSQPTAVTIDPVPACTEIWQRYDRERERTLKSYKATESKKDQAIFAKAIRLEEEGDAEHRRCVGERAKDQRWYSAVVKQAQALADSLP